MAGVSTQQIRNYEGAGILPPARRSPSGYRELDVRHRLALFTYRTLGKGYGWNTAREIMRTVHDGEPETALALIDASHAELHEQRVSLKDTGAALETVAEQPVDESTLPRSAMRIGQAATYLGVRTSALRVWEAAGLLSPQREAGTNYRSYASTDLRNARMINLLGSARYRLSQMWPILDGLRRTGSSEALRAAIAQRHAELTTRSRAMLEGSHRLHDYLVSGHPSTVDGH